MRVLTRPVIITDAAQLSLGERSAITNEKNYDTENLLGKLSSLSGNELGNVHSICLASIVPPLRTDRTRDTVHVDQFITRTWCIIQTFRVYV